MSGCPEDVPVRSVEWGWLMMREDSSIEKKKPPAPGEAHGRHTDRDGLPAVLA